jgi:stage II sporulation protein AA (anti-sigma F factor antagonist)
MAKHFQINARETAQQGLSLQLLGDFDGSSACELIHFIDQFSQRPKKVAIETDGLRTVNTFGLDVFLPTMMRLSRNGTDIVFRGKHKWVFLQE